ncbi:hypothetical protein POTOM_057459 [Populus tomentosa]|uniref:Uncharacterized protein n=1 Tax=Populus tomentosa TaxID=118781 RepID=A0A8X7XX09_POPTO|nr:hypothetical protein POTOM_057459 [Populus tomentosa]
MGQIDTVEKLEITHVSAIQKKSDVEIGLILVGVTVMINVLMHAQKLYVQTQILLVTSIVVALIHDRRQMCSCIPSFLSTNVKESKSYHLRTVTMAAIDIAILFVAFTSHFTLTMSTTMVATAPAIPKPKRLVTKLIHRDSIFSPCYNANGTIADHAR